MKILAVDYGETRTGLAICDESELLATPLPQITEKSMNKVAAYIAEAAAKEGAARILLGLPMNMDGTEFLYKNQLLVLHFTIHLLK